MSILKWFIVVAALELISAPRVQAQNVGNCDPALGEAYLDANNVLARIPNNGMLFYRGEPHVYTVPRFTGKGSIFAGGIWIGGMIDGKIRMAATRYGPYEFWAGPLDDAGNPPADCSEYDRVFKVSTADVEAFEATRTSTPDLAAWPTGLGAPTLDGSGSLIEIMHLPFEERKNRVINLLAGERPLVKGDQTLWWVMNDRGNNHTAAATPPVGLEVHGMAFASTSSRDAINDATLFEYRVFYRNTEPMSDAYIGIYLDPDLGNAKDDYIGADTLLGMGFVYNADDFDETTEGYGARPPAVGVHLLQTPIADTDGVDNDRDGTVDEEGEHPGMSHLIQNTYAGLDIREPPQQDVYYNFLRGRWWDGEPLTVGGRGRGYSEVRANYMYPGDPVTREFWSEINSDGNGTGTNPGDRRFVISSGPFELHPDEVKEFSFSVVWARGDDHLDSVRKLRRAAVEVRDAYEAGYSGFQPGLAPYEAVTLLSPGYGVTGQTRDPVLAWEKIVDADAYDIEIIGADSTISLLIPTTSFRLSEIKDDSNFGWRVRARNSFGEGPWSDQWWFRTGTGSFANGGAFSSFSVVQNAAGILDPPDMAAFSFNQSGFPGIRCSDDPETLCTRPTRDYQQSSTDATWGFHAGDAKTEFGPTTDSLSFLGRVTRRGANLEAIGLSDYEIRFTGANSKAVIRYDENTVIDVPFELWKTGIATPNDPSDDVRLIPMICEAACGAGTDEGIFDIGGDHVISGGKNDPYTDWIYWYEPPDMRPGQDGYLAYFAGSGRIGREIFARMVLVAWNGGNERPYKADLPETGTVFRISGSVVPPPVLSAPTHDLRMSSGDVSFYWDGTAVDVFRIHIDHADLDYHLTVVDEAPVVSGYTPPTLGPGRYSWAIYSAVSGWSDPWSFEISEDVDDLTIPTQPVLLGNYPNPFSASTSVSYFLPERSPVELRIYDILGREYGIIVSTTQAPGRHEITFDGMNYSSGVYFYHFRAGDFSDTKMMTVVK